MYTREEASKARELFWTKFGKYMLPVLSASGEKINWINYKTGIPNLAFKMNATKDEAYIGIEIMHKDEEQARKIYDLFVSLKVTLEAELEEQWTWVQDDANEYGQPLSRISTKLQDVNIFKEGDWPAIISFLKPRLMHLDQFWDEHKMIFEMSL